MAKTHVIQRIRAQWMYVFYDMVDRENAQRRKGEKNPAQLDAPVTNDTDMTGMDYLADARVGDICDVVALKDSIRRFEIDHPAEGQVINALARGDEKQKVASLMGQSTYNAYARDRVHRIRQMFRTYL